MINVLSRPLVAVVCSLFAMLLVAPAYGQKFMPQEIVEAEVINDQMRDRIMMVVEPVMFDLTREEPKPSEITDARKQLQQLFRVNQPSVAYLEALSSTITGQMKEAVEHPSPLVRINAMIVMTTMVDDGSKPFIDAGLKDESDAVKHWAMQALGKRMLWWKARVAAGARGSQAKIDEAIAQIVKLIDVAEPPHPIVVAPALDALWQVNTPLSRESLIQLLNKRVTLHASNPDLPYSAERSVVEGFANALTIEASPDLRSIIGLSQAMSRYALLIVQQSQANRISEDLQPGANAMLFNCLQGMASVSVAAKAPKSPPAEHSQARGWITNGRWDELKGMIEKDWAAILTSDPFKLKPTDLVVQP